MKKLHCKFHPQIWINDDAFPVDPQGSTEWYVDWDGPIPEDCDYQSDDLRFEGDAPEWIRNWDGPFEVTILNRNELETNNSVDRENQVKELVDYANELSCEPHDLDEIVLDAIISDSLEELNNIELDKDRDEFMTSLEIRSSDINNQGLEEQIRTLLDLGFTYDEVRDVLCER